MTFLQLGIGLHDLTCTAYAMYLLMLEQPAIDFLTLAVIFASATLLGFASHAPGSMGVFDAAMLVALNQYTKAEMVAALLLFRLLYFIIPFACALTALGLREIYWSMVNGKTPKVKMLDLLKLPAVEDPDIGNEPKAEPRNVAARRRWQSATVARPRTANVSRLARNGPSNGTDAEL